MIDYDFIAEMISEGVSQDVVDRLTPDEKDVYIKLKRESEMTTSPSKKVTKKTASKKVTDKKPVGGDKKALGYSAEQKPDVKATEKPSEKVKGRTIDKDSRRQQSLRYFITNYGTKTNKEIKEWMSNLGYTKNATSTIFYSFVKMRKNNEI